MLLPIQSRCYNLLVDWILSNSRYSYQVKEVCSDDRRSGDYLNVGIASSLFDGAAPPQ